MSELDSLFSIIKKAKEKYKDTSPEPVIQQEISPLNSLFEKIKEKQEEKKQDSAANNFFRTITGTKMQDEKDADDENVAGV